MSKYLVSYASGAHSTMNNNIVEWKSLSEDSISKFEIYYDCVVIAVTKLDK